MEKKCVRVYIYRCGTITPAETIVQSEPLPAIDPGLRGGWAL
eukprot:COSAG06_NODE_27730_length_587_cov_1.102459_1_plen_41_part_10